MGVRLRVWVTRAQPAAEATAARLRALGHDPLVAPLLQIQPLAGVGLDLAGVGALAFTSANAVAAYATLTPIRGLPVFAVGEATAQAARDAGFAHVVASNGDVNALARRIAAEPRLDGVVLHPGAAEPAGDLASTLTGAGVRARALTVYAAEVVGSLPDLGPPPDAVLLHSPKAARALADLLPPASAAGLDAFALSPACAAPLAELGLRRIEIAPFPNEAALLERLVH